MGGDWAEGWQYGDHVVVSLTLYADAERALGGPNVFERLPWLREVVRHHTHAILPDGAFAYDGGDWSDKPARMPASGLWALAALLPEGIPERSASLALARALRDRVPRG